jgi:hypothetical protein
MRTGSGTSVLLSALGMPVAKIGEVTFTSPERVGLCFPIK